MLVVERATVAVWGHVAVCAVCSWLMCHGWCHSGGGMSCTAWILPCKYQAAGNELSVCCLSPAAEQNFFVCGRTLPLWIVTIALLAQGLDSNATLGNAALSYK